MPFKWEKVNQSLWLVMWWQWDEPQVGLTFLCLPPWLLAALKGSAMGALPVAGLPPSSPYLIPPDGWPAPALGWEWRSWAKGQGCWGKSHLLGWDGWNSWRPRMWETWANRAVGQFRPVGILEKVPDLSSGKQHSSRQVAKMTPARSTWRPWSLSWSLSPRAESKCALVPGI